MNTKRITFWLGFVVIIGLIIWGLVVAMNKTPNSTSKIGVPAPVTSSDNVEGSSSARVTLIEYGDFQCPACSTYAFYVERLFNEASSTMRVVFRHFPLSQHPNAIPAARAAEAAGVQGKFWDMYRLLYANQSDWSEKTTTEANTIFDGYATTLKLDMTNFKADEMSSSTIAKIMAQEAEGQKIGIDHTPSFFVNGREVNPNTYEEFKTIIDAALSGTAE